MQYKIWLGNWKRIFLTIARMKHTMNVIAGVSFRGYFLHNFLRDYMNTLIFTLLSDKDANPVSHCYFTLNRLRKIHFMVSGRTRFYITELAVVQHHSVSDLRDGDVGGKASLTPKNAFCLSRCMKLSTHLNNANPIPRTVEFGHVDSEISQNIKRERTLCR